MRLDAHIKAGPWLRTTTALYSSALLLLVVGGALVLLSRFSDPPRLEELARTGGVVGAKRLHANTRGAPYLELIIDGGRYTLASYRRLWLDSIARLLPAGERVVVWSREVPNGSGQIFQLQRGDSLVVPYLERRQRAESQNQRSGAFGEGMMFLAVALAIAGRTADLVAKRRRSVTMAE